MNYIHAHAEKERKKKNEIKKRLLFTACPSEYLLEREVLHAPRHLEGPAQEISGTQGLVSLLGVGRGAGGLHVVRVTDWQQKGRAADLIRSKS